MPLEVRAGGGAGRGQEGVGVRAGVWVHASCCCTDLQPWTAAATSPTLLACKWLNSL